MSNKTTDKKLSDSNNGEANRANSDNRKCMEVNVMSSVNDTENSSSPSTSDNNYNENVISDINNHINQIMKFAREDSSAVIAQVEQLTEQLLLNPYEYVALHFLKLNSSEKNRLQILMGVLNSEPNFHLFLRIVDILCTNDKALQLLSYDVKTVDKILDSLSMQNIVILAKIIIILQRIAEQSSRSNFSSNWIHYFQKHVHFETDIISILTQQTNGHLLMNVTNFLLSLSAISATWHVKVNMLSELFFYHNLVPALTTSCIHIILLTKTSFLKLSEVFEFVCNWLTLINKIIKDGKFSFPKCGGVIEYNKMMLAIRRILELYQWPDVSAHIKLKDYFRMIHSCIILLHDLHIPDFYVPPLTESSFMNIIYNLQNVHPEKERIDSKEYNVLLSDMRKYWIYVVAVSKHELLFEALHYCKPEVVEFLMHLVRYAGSILPDPAAQF